jgi:2',3'-cyclic-nucleotide 2'-phosphodiesterase (5'-nucleotidase family)
VTLSRSEFSHDLDYWKAAADSGLPIVVANLFYDSKGRKPVFDQYYIKTENGVRLGVIGFASRGGFDQLQNRDSLNFVSPFDMKKLVRKVAKKSDHLTLMGDFAKFEADSLAKLYPEADLILAGGLNSNQPIEVGETLIMGTPSKGYYGDYVDWKFVKSDTLKPFDAKHVTLDAKVQEDAKMQSLLKKSGL